MSGIVESIGTSLATSLLSAGLTYILTPTQKLESGRKNDLTIGKTSYGAPLPWCWGKVRVAGNLVWSAFLEEDKTTTRQGKGAKVQTTNYSYYGSFATMFADCPFRPVADIPRIWMNKKLVFSKVGGAETIAQGGKFADQYLRFYLGDDRQEIDPLLQNLDSIQNYSYGLPTNKAEKEAYLRSLGINPLTVAQTPAYNQRAYIVATRLPLDDFFSSLPVVEAELVGSENCTAGQIIGDIFSLFYEAQRYDTSLISTPEFAVSGFYIDSLEAAKNTIQTLQKAYFFDLIESNGVYKFVPLNYNRTAINLSAQDIAAYPAKEQKPSDYQIIESDPASLPSEVVVSYIDKDLNYDRSEQRSSSQVLDYYNPNSVTLSFNIVMSANQAAMIADRSLFLGLLLSKTYKFQLPWSYLILEIGDIIPNVFSGGGFLKITQIRIGANLLIECEAQAHDLSFWNYQRNILTGGITVGIASYEIAIATDGIVIAVSDRVTGRLYIPEQDYIIDDSGSVLPIDGGAIGIGTELAISTNRPVRAQDSDLGIITPPSPIELLLLDIPLIRDEDPDYTLYVAVAGEGNNWKGASIFVSADNSRYLFLATATNQNIFGAVIDIDLPNATYTVIINQGQLESISISDLSLGLNLALLGDKIIQFRLAQLIDTNTYLISDIIGDLRGTDAVDRVVLGDRFVILKNSQSNVIRIQGSVDDIGQVRYFKAVSPGQTLDEVEAVEIEIAGVSVRPYSPIQVTATKNAVGDIVISWSGRNRRVSEPNTSGKTYLIEVVAVGVLVLRSTSTNDPTWIYPISEQIEDFGESPDNITVKIAEVDPIFGIGSPVIITLSPSEFEPVPEITSFSPASGGIGDQITISGSNLALVSSISINDIEQNNLAVAGSNSISFTLAQGTVSGAIKVNTDGGEIRSALPLIVQEKELLISDRYYTVPGDFPDINSALISLNNKVLSNVTVQIANGTYIGDLSINNIITTPAGLKIIGSGNTIIRGLIDIAASGANILLENLILSGYSNGFGMYCRNKINLIARNLDIFNFAIAINLASNSTADLENVSIENCIDYGLQVGSNSTVNCDNVSIFACGDGFFANNSSSIIGNNCISQNNTRYGFRCEVNSAIYLSNTTVGNNQFGDYNPVSSGVASPTNGIIFY